MAALRPDAQPVESVDNHIYSFLLFAPAGRRRRPNQRRSPPRGKPRITDIFSVPTIPPPRWGGRVDTAPFPRVTLRPLPAGRAPPAATPRRPVGADKDKVRGRARGFRFAAGAETRRANCDLETIPERPLFVAQPRTIGAVLFRSFARPDKAGSATSQIRRGGADLRRGTRILSGRPTKSRRGGCGDPPRKCGRAARRFAGRGAAATRRGRRGVPWACAGGGRRGPASGRSRPRRCWSRGRQCVPGAAR